VLCPGINDGEELDRTLQDLANLTPNLLSLSLVPVGITSYRRHLYPLQGYSSKESRQVIEQAEGWQKKFLQTEEVNLVYVADEFYLSAGSPVPPAEAYDDFPQLENGVGMVRLFMDEFEDHKDRLPAMLPRPHTVSIACGLSAEKVLQPVVNYLNRIKNLQVNLMAVENHFFGGGVTVTGLLTGKDLIQTLKAVPLGEELFISSVMLKDGGDLFLDNMRLQDVQEALGTKITPVSDVRQFIDRFVHIAP
jgi:putative radical SAM enzyme (TIGR03279 family)